MLKKNKKGDEHMTEMYYNCQVHGRSRVTEVDMDVKQSISMKIGVILTTYRLECGCTITNTLPSKVNNFINDISI